MIPSPKTLTTIISNLSWTGHVELPFVDIQWLAGEIFRALSGGLKPDQCGICGGQEQPTVKTLLGVICVGCIEDLHEETWT